MTYLWGLLTSVGHIVFLRGSPERLYYTRRLFIVSLLLALVASAAAQFLYFGDPFVFVILRVFAEVTLFMLMIVLLTAKIARFRLARMMLVLVLISLFADLILVVLSVGIPQAQVTAPLGRTVSWAVGGVALYGAGSVLAWGLRRSYFWGLGVIILYVVAVLALDSAFRELYAVMASGA